MRHRPLLAGVLLLGILGFGYWFVMLGGGASGSTAQAEQVDPQHRVDRTWPAHQRIAGRDRPLHREWPERPRAACLLLPRR